MRAAIAAALGLIAGCQAGGGEPDAALAFDGAVPDGAALREGEAPGPCPCPLGTHCDRTTHLCAPGCLGDDHCPAGSRCDPQAFVCQPICDAKTTCPLHMACAAAGPSGVRLCAPCTAKGCACAAGFGDCDGDLRDGCETPLDTLTDCRACGRAAVDRCARDADGDGYAIPTQVETRCGCDHGWVGVGASKGVDCDDTAAAVHPGQTAFFTAPRSTGGFDYDCDGQVERRYPYRADGLCDFACADSFWVGAEPACGQAGTARHCNYPSRSGGCAIGSVITVTQECR